MFVLARRLSIVALAVLAIGCEELKSSNPLSPQVAGPMAGINMSTPLTVSPSAGARIDDQDQPVTLVVTNPDTNTPRQVVLRVQVASDAGFQTIVYARQDVPPGANGQTVFHLDRLPSGRTYYWRTRADDGANDSGWSAVASFAVLQPVVIGAPHLRSPIGNATVSTVTPDLVIDNAVSSGPHGTIHYQFQVSDSQAFANLVVNGQADENASGQTHFVTPAITLLDHTLFWRVRGFDDRHSGDWSSTDSFHTPASAGPPSGGGSGGGGSFDTSVCEQYINDKPTLSQCVHDIVRPGPTVEDAFEVTKRIAWALRSEGAGLLIKTGGENIISWQGYSFSAGRVCYPDGHIYKVLTDIPATNGASWQDDDFVSPSLYVPAINPN